MPPKLLALHVVADQPTRTEIAHYVFSVRRDRGRSRAAFGRVKMDRIAFDYNYFDNNSMQRKGSANLDETLIGGGIMLGCQIITRKKWTIDSI